MGDSDDEGSSRRSKFRSERDFDDDSGRRFGDHRSSWSGNSRNSSRYDSSQKRNYDGHADNYKTRFNHVNRSSPPPHKRGRSDWNDDGGNRFNGQRFSNNMSNYGHRGQYDNSDGPGWQNSRNMPSNNQQYFNNGNSGHSNGSWGNRSSQMNNFGPSGRSDVMNQSSGRFGDVDDENSGRDFGHRSGKAGISSGSQMLTLKAFLERQDDSISDEEALQKYTEYKLDFKRQQLNDFFVTHKDEEWFRQRYHPEESVTRHDEQRRAVLNRLEIFNKFVYNSETGSLRHDIAVDADHSDALVRHLDSVVILLEGGSETDLKILEHPDDVNSNHGPTIQSGESTTEANNGDNGERHDATNNSTEADDNSVGADESAKDNDGGEEVENDMKESNKNGTDDRAENGHQRPRALHKTASIFLRNLPPTITRAEVEAMCRRFPGFLRAAIAEPQPERRFFRRGWVTFERDVRIKEICYALASVRLRDCELGPIINRDLTRRIRTVNGIASDFRVMRADIKWAVKLVNIFDRKWNLYRSEDVDGDDVDANTVDSDDLPTNPLLANITDFLIEEASAEEEELLGAAPPIDDDLDGGQDSSSASATGAENAVVMLERDIELIDVLDRLILYLRVVHSVDFYNHCEYPNEDSMPNRLGIMHARGIPPLSEVVRREMDDYIGAFGRRMTVLIKNQTRQKLTADEMKKMGAKLEEDEIEKFMQANTQELAKDKWLCPLSGKKFKGPEFVRKHIVNKHSDKLDEVKREVVYFNRFLADPRRPYVFEPKVDKVQSGTNQAMPPQQHQMRQQQPFIHGQQNIILKDPNSAPPMMNEGPMMQRRQPGPMARYNANRGRPIITYKDLDAPRDDF